MIETITEYLLKLADKMDVNALYYTFLGLLAFVFIVSLIAGASNKEWRKFRKGARKLIGDNGHSVEKHMKDMPESVVHAYNRARTLGGNPADFISLESCVSVPFRVSAMSKLATINFFATLFCTFLGYTLATVWGGGSLIGAALLLVCGGVLTLVAAIISAVSYRSAVKLYNGFVLVLRRACENAAPAARPAQVPPVAPAAPAAAPAAPTAPAAPPVDYAAAEARAAAVPEEDVVARIDRISREGASLSVMREVALLLQQERAKPENKTPEQQRRLNEALSKLLKAMSVNKN